LLNLFNADNFRTVKQCHKYEAYWEREPTMNDTVKTAWPKQGGNEHLGQIASKLQGVMSDLRTWSKKTIGSVPKKVDK
jgi:hypothetical protein